MTYQVLMVQVLIASPGDTGSARNVIRTAMEDWNALNSEATGIAFSPRMWERDVVPDIGAHPQAIINRQIVDKADVIIGTFWTRLGTPTLDEASGTVEEIKRAHGAGKPTLVYFSNEPVLMDSVDAKEYASLVKFKKWVQDNGVYSAYANEAQLREKITAHLTYVAREHFARDASRFVDATSTPSSLPQAALVASCESEREMTGVDKTGRPHFSSRYHFAIRNEGDAAAENLTFDFESPADAPDPPQAIGVSPVSRLTPRGSLNWPLAASMGDATQWDVVMRWEEAGVAHEDRQTVRLN
jgi:hypothetical protein